MLLGACNRPARRPAGLPSLAFSHLLSPARAFHHLPSPAHTFPHLLTPAHTFSQVCLGSYPNAELAALVYARFVGAEKARALKTWRDKLSAPPLTKEEALARARDEGLHLQACDSASGYHGVRMDPRVKQHGFQYEAWVHVGYKKQMYVCLLSPSHTFARLLTPSHTFSQVRLPMPHGRGGGARGRALHQAGGAAAARRRPATRGAAAPPSAGAHPKLFSEDW